MVARISAPTLSGVTPRLASISIWPGAVAPPWLPMAGKTKGSAPAARTSSTTARTMTGRLLMPRLPAPTATRMPGLMRCMGLLPRSAARTVSEISSMRGASKCCSTSSKVSGSCAGKRSPLTCSTRCSFIVPACLHQNRSALTQRRGGRGECAEKAKVCRPISPAPRLPISPSAYLCAFASLRQDCLTHAILRPLFSLHAPRCCG